MKKLCLVLGCTLIAAITVQSAFAQQTQSLVLAPLQNDGKIADQQIKTLTRFLENALQRTRRFDVVDRSAVEDILKEHGFQLTDLSDTRKTAQLGKLLNADVLVRPSVMPMGGEFYLESRIVDLTTAKILNSAEIRIKADLSDAYEKLSEFAAALAGGVTAAPPAAAASAANMARLPGGMFMMGSNSGDADEKPVHQVTVSGFYIGKYQVTQKEYQEIMGSNPSNFKGDNLPVEKVSWFDAIEYCNRRSIKEGLTPAYSGTTWNTGANGYRLPTEAEWEYACGTMQSGDGWHNGNSGGKTHPVGERSANSHGLYDMLGNVYEWCWDWYGSYSSGSQTDPRGPSSGSDRVNRGGSWYSSAQYLRSAYRSHVDPSNRNSNLGFRLARSP